MSVATNIPTPPVPSGSPAEQIRQIWSYLFRLAELLNATKGGGDDVRKTP